jgi:NACHT domain/N-terminal domain of NWD NACHT-NTPase
MKSICSYYRSRIVDVLRALILLDDWKGDLEQIKEAESSLQIDATIYKQEQHTCLLQELVRSFQSLDETLEGHARREDDKRCLQNMQVLDPWSEIKEIESRKDDLIRESFEWVLDTKEFKKFTHWQSTDNCKLLWLKGHAGQGKTMLMIGMIKEITREINFSNLSENDERFHPGVSFFFCQGGDNRINNATAVLRNLTWQLLVRQEELIDHCRDKYRFAGDKLFGEQNAFFNMTGILTEILEDGRLDPVVLLIDAIDECSATSRKPLLDFILTTASTFPKVKWLVSSRPEVDIASYLNADLPFSSVTLDLNKQSLAKPIESFITHKLEHLKKKRKDFKKEHLKLASEKLYEGKGKNTFLWVSLVCRELENANTRSIHVDKVLEEMPLELTELYEQIIANIEKLKRGDDELCKRVLTVVAFAYQPLHELELGLVMGLAVEELLEIVHHCGSLLVVQNHTLFLIHQSAKTFLRIPGVLQPSSEMAHFEIFQGAVDGLISKLPGNIVALTSLDAGGSQANPAEEQHQGYDDEKISLPLLEVKYSCLFLIDHLCDLVSVRQEYLVQALDRSLDFLKFDSLYWVEVLAFFGPSSLSRGILSFMRLKDLLQVR